MSMTGRRKPGWEDDILVSTTAIARLQTRMMLWLLKNFGENIATSRPERAARILEEAAELAQAEGVTPGQASRIVSRAYERPAGEPRQEAAGVTTTLLAWAGVTGTDLLAVANAEMDRVEKIPVDDMRRKHDEKVQAGTATSGVKFVLVLAGHAGEFDRFCRELTNRERAANTTYVRVMNAHSARAYDRNTTRYVLYGRWDLVQEAKEIVGVLQARYRPMQESF